MRSYVICPNRDSSKVSLEICLTRCEEKHHCDELAEVPRSDLEEMARKLKIPISSLPEEVIDVSAETDADSDCTSSAIKNGNTENQKGILKKGSDDPPNLPVARENLKPNNAKNKRAMELYEKVLTLKKDVETKFLQMGAVLNEIYDQKYYIEIGYQDWKQFCSEALDIKWRWALYLRAIYLKKDQLKLSDQDCAEVGVKKMAEILPMMKDKKNAEHWLKEAKKPGVTTERLIAKVRHARGRITKDEAEKVPVKYILPVYEEDVETVERAFELAREVTQSDSRGVQFVAMVEEFRATWEHESGDFNKARIVIGWLRRFEGLMKISITGDIVDAITGEVFER